MEIKYPFSINTDETRYIQAYWYNIPECIDAFKHPRFNISTYSSLCIYGRTLSDNFKVKVTVLLKDGNIIFSKNFNINQEDNNNDFEIEAQNGFFKLIQKVEYAHDLPYKILIEITDTTSKRIKEIQCVYHKLHGTVEDFNNNPFEAFIRVSPDGFEEGIGVWCDEQGRYEITLPERTYNSIFVDDETYGIKTVEAWGWHIIMDCSQELGFKVGTGEVYNLNAWANNGGARTFFISFRPMLLMPQNDINSNDTVISDEDILANLRDCEIEGKMFKILDLAPELSDKNIKVHIDQIEVSIYSVNKFYEIISDTMAMPAYIIQVDAKDIKRCGKHTIEVEYHSEKESHGVVYNGNSMGCYQLYMNFSGLSSL